MATCDEMRDHLFQLLRPKYFKRWKQRHQVYYKCVPFCILNATLTLLECHVNMCIRVLSVIRYPD